MQNIFWYDWVISFFLILIVLAWTNKFVKKHSSDILLVKYFKTGLILKIIGAIAYVIYHQYIYRGGDTLVYFDIARQINKYFTTDFERYIKLVFYPVEKSLDVRRDDVWPDNIMIFAENNMFQIRLASVIQLFTFNSLIPTSLIFSLFAYLGIWRCFKSFVRLYPDSAKNIAISFIFIPTVIFWGSGISKESVCIGSICALTTSIFNFFIFRERLIKSLFSMFFFTGILLVVKPYIAISFLPPMFLGLVFLKIQNIKNLVFRMMVYPLSLILIAIVVISILDYTSQNFSSFAVDNLAERIVSTSVGMGKEANSSYDLGISAESINSMGDLLPYFSKGIVATLYRPWLWEIKNPAMLLSALEGFVFLLLTLYVLIKGKIYQALIVIIRNPILFSCYIYLLIFAGLVGLSTSNFGTLVRYKLPIMPFWGLALLIVLDQLKTKKINQDIPDNNSQDTLSDIPSSLS